jgi:hypothetical protein
MTIGTMLLFLVGIIIICAIVWAIIQQLGLPPNVVKWIIVAMLVVLLIVAIQFFFGGGIGGVSINGGEGVRFR